MRERSQGKEGEGKEREKDERINGWGIERAKGKKGQMQKEKQKKRKQEKEREGGREEMKSLFESLGPAIPSQPYPWTSVIMSQILFCIYPF